MRTGERGSVAIELPFLLGLVLIPFGVFLLSVSTWVERQTAARDAAAEVGRLVVVDPQADVNGLLRSIEAGFGLPADALELDIDGSFEPGTEVETSVSVEIPGMVLPIFGSVGSTTWTAGHVERVADYGEAIS